VPRTTIYGHLAKNTVGGRPRAKKPATSAEQAEAAPQGPSTASVAEIRPRPLPARLLPPIEDQSPQERERLVRQRRRRAGPSISSLACPNCGHEPTARYEALQQREDLAIVWLYQPTARAAITEHAHCAHCQPHVPTELLACTRCGDGPILTGALVENLHRRVDQLPTALRHWLAEHGWQTAPELLCPHDT
jgi:hypothetical protein